MDTDEILSRIKRVTAEHIGVSAEKIELSSNFINDLGCDSLDQVELVMAYEEEFEIEINDNKAEKIETIQQAVDYIKKTINPK